MISGSMVSLVPHHQPQGLPDLFASRLVAADHLIKQELTHPTSDSLVDLANTVADLGHLVKQEQVEQVARELGREMLATPMAVKSLATLGKALARTLRQLDDHALAADICQSAADVLGMAVARADEDDLPSLTQSLAGLSEFAPAATVQAARTLNDRLREATPLAINFDRSAQPSAEKTWQGFSRADWEGPGVGRGAAPVGEPGLPASSERDHHLGLGSPLNVTGTRAGASSLRNG